MIKQCSTDYPHRIPRSVLSEESYKFEPLFRLPRK